MNKVGRKVAFVGSQDFADFHGIGGMQSYIRRLGLELARRGYIVDYLVCGAQQEEEVIPVDGVCVKYFRLLVDALAELPSGSYSAVTRVWLARRDRFDFVRYVLSHKALPFHYIWFVVPDSLSKRLLTFLEGMVISRGGYLFCVSPMQWRVAKCWTRKACLLLPPVPQEFFLEPEEKPLRWPLKVTFLGVLHPDKGIEEVVELFKMLRDDPRFECSIYAIHNPKVPLQVKLHKRLLQERSIKYVPMERGKWSVELEKEVQAILAKTDVFVQPFQSLQNTVDTPVLVLEAMTSLCAVLTTPIGSIPEIYGESQFLIPHSGFVERAADLLMKLGKEDLLKERMRIYRRNKELSFSQAEVADKFIAAIEKERRGEINERGL